MTASLCFVSFYLGIGTGLLIMLASEAKTPNVWKYPIVVAAWPFLALYMLRRVK